MVNSVLKGSALLCYLAGAACLISAAFVMSLSFMAALTGGPPVGSTSFDDPAALGLCIAFGVGLFAIGRILERLARQPG